VGAIPPPAGDKEVVKVNVYERGISLNSQLAPLFPYFGPGSLVACAAVQRGRPEEHGQFFHENSQEEVSLALGSNLARMSTGDLLIAPKVHGVNAFLKDAHDPEAFLFFLIIQRQSEPDANPEEQYEAMHLRCEKCQEMLLRHTFSADPGRPLEHGGREGDRFGMFATLWGCLSGAEKFNADEALRTCGKCGHLNPPFPFATWGWQHWVKQQRVANSARAAMLAAAADRLAPAEVAG
jgi:hypothetical protein